MAKQTSKTAKTSPAPRWFPIRRGDGTITGHIQMFWSKAGWVTIPGRSEFRNA